jgi:E3 ubiquitin-protein ligase TRIP12
VTSTSVNTASPTKPSNPPPPMKSYASAASVSQDSFELNFTIDGEEVPKESTIFGYLYRREMNRLQNNPRADGTKKDQVVNVWSSLPTIHFKKVPVASPPTSLEKASSSSSSSSSLNSTPEVTRKQLSTSKQQSPTIELYSSSEGKILLLLQVLYYINSQWSYIIESGYESRNCLDNKAHVIGEAAVAADGIHGVAYPQESVPASSILISALSVNNFTNSKIVAKLNRQLNEPLIVAANALPDWCSIISREFSFIVSFETRLTYLQSTSFGFTRSMGRWQQLQDSNQSHQRPGSSSNQLQSLGRIQRQKVRIARPRILESMMKVMKLYGSTQMLLEVEFYDEVGTGLGPTLEFYSLVCYELRKRSGVSISISSGSKQDAVMVENLVIWRDDGRLASSSDQVLDEYLNPQQGLFPMPITETYAKSDVGMYAALNNYFNVVIKFL